MDERDYDYEVAGEVIKMIHNELPAVRWTCAGCGEDACQIFYQPEVEATLLECEGCGALNLVRRPKHG